MADVEMKEWWHFHVVKGVHGGFTALAKKEPFVNGDPIREPGEVWFEFGDTIGTAMNNLKRSIGIQ